jgi:iron complex outermembrane recepter protein
MKQGEHAETRFHNMFVRRSPEVNELYSNGLHQGIAGIEEGDWNLTPELSFKSIITQSFLLKELLHIELTAYAHFIDNYIFLKPQDELRLTIRGAFPVYKYVQENAFIRGLDLGVIADISENVEWSAKASLLKGSTYPGNVPLSLMPPAFYSTTLSWSIGELWKMKGTRLSIEGAYTAKQKNWDEEGELLVPPDDYFLVSGKIETGIKLKSNKLNAGLQVDNLFNTEYRDYLNRLRYFADEQGLSVRINLRYEF